MEFQLQVNGMLNIQDCKTYTKPSMLTVLTENLGIESVSFCELNCCYLTAQVELTVICKIPAFCFLSLIIVLDNQDCYLDNYLPGEKKLYIYKKRIKLEEVQISH